MHQHLNSHHERSCRNGKIGKQKIIYFSLNS
ncbi:Protein CBG28065 [Caenorhabditis briggsae]|uniref:Protein CBG28065 n=1 Tax=Caenorhabditis briggsae TaxID=6238 RepID=B6IGQ5_CAEBR|nr:Protein CBG28065 [Caenorhabditis briggsae]CAR99085.1 Protein CBG28065 [Caenorhabditis briggsae]